MKPGVCKTCPRTESSRWYVVEGICNACYQKRARLTDPSKAKESLRKYRAKPEVQATARERLRLARIADPEQFKKYSQTQYIKNRDAILAKARSNPKRAEYKKTEYEKNKAGYLFRAWMRKQVVRRATPKWVDKKELKRWVSERPDGYGIDHILPLQGELVSGLNVPWNLQYLTLSENSAKFNDFDGTYENESWRTKFRT